MRNFIHACVFVALAATSAVTAAKDKSFEHQFNTRVSVDAAGQVTDVEFLKDVPEALQAMVRGVAADIPFEPAMRDGLAVPSRTSMQLRVAFTPDGENYRAKVLSINGGMPASVGLHQPNFPASVLRARKNMVAIVVVRPHPDGKANPEANTVESVRFYRDDQPLEGVSTRLEREMHEALLEAAAHWDYILEEVDGVAITTELRIPITLCITKRMSTRDRSRDICDQWRDKVMEGFGRPEPVEPGLRLAQPRWEAPPSPTA